MSHSNPLERFFDAVNDVEQVERIDESETDEKEEIKSADTDVPVGDQPKEEEEVETETPSIFSNIGQILGAIEGEMKKVVEKEENDARWSGASVHGFDFESPRLPGEGLKTRLISREEMCARNSHQMKWYEGHLNNCCA